ncbi:MAG: multicopper oxidase domain-containing protein [Gammaproteobacteria bacterium]|nr:multicopper oxidase domain-containing protein [Gammaproteobacteria bacterium]
MNIRRLLRHLVFQFFTGIFVVGTTITAAQAGNPNIPTDMPPSPLWAAIEFNQQMLRFEEFAVRKVPDSGSTVAKTFPAPTACDGRPSTSAMDSFLNAPLWPDPSVQANEALDNPWAAMINACIPGAAPSNGVIEGRPPGVAFAHQRADEFPPQYYFNTAQGGARTSNGRLDGEQRHHYAVGEFGPEVSGLNDETGLYNNTVGVSGFNHTTNGIPIKFCPTMPSQDPVSLWTFGDGTLPPKLLQARYGQPVMMRHYNALPIDEAANAGFGEHTITTHEHNGHNPGESDGFAGSYFFPGEFWDYRWPMTMAGFDTINRTASDPRASTPCSPGEVLNIPDPISGHPIPKTCDPDTLTVNVAGDWHEIMSTHWFHDHMIDRTAQNVYKGNAAMMNYYSGIDRGEEGFKCNYADPSNVNLCFPSGTALDWGNRDYDVNLLLADKAWVPVTGQLAFAPFNTDGFLGDRMTVNWLYKPHFDVRARRYRFRILDGSVSRFFKIAIVREYDDATSGEFPGPAGSNKSYSRIHFHMIANDGNIMEHAVPFPNAQSNDLPIQAIAERHDIIIDFSQFPVGTKLYMVNTLAFDNGKGPKTIIPLASILDGTFAPIINKPADCLASCWSDDPTVGKFLEFRVQPYSGTDLSMNPADYEVGKKVMIPLVKITDAELASATHRTFRFGRGGGVSSDGSPIPWTIATDGGAALNADTGRVSAAPETMGGGWEIWHIVNAGGGWAHPVHVHFEEGQYLLRRDVNQVGGVISEHLPPLWEIGARKDMYRVSGLGIALGIPDSSMEIDVAIRFREFAGTFVEHCHNTQHEDKAMLLRWDNEHPGQTVRIPTPIPTWDGVTYVATTELATIKTGDVLAASTYVAPTQLVGDLDWDGIVGLPDYLKFRSQYGQVGPLASDFDENGIVGLSDYLTFRVNYGKSAGFPVAPNNPLP